MSHNCQVIKSSFNIVTYWNFFILLGIILGVETGGSLELLSLTIRRMCQQIKM